MLKIDREKYIRIAKTSGAATALTALHHDVNQWEYQAFEGEQGYQPQMIADLEQVRVFSRELWEIALQNPPAAR